MASKRELEKRIEALEAENKVMIAGILKISGDLDY